VWKLVFIQQRIGIRFLRGLQKELVRPLRKPIQVLAFKIESKADALPEIDMLALEFCLGRRLIFVQIVKVVMGPKLLAKQRRI